MSLSKRLSEFHSLLQTVPPVILVVFPLSFVCANLAANKELFSVAGLALDAGFAFSWIMFLCMDVLCKTHGARNCIKVSFFALLVNLAVTLIFFLLSLTPGKWSQYYVTGSDAVNDALNATFASSWYVVFGSALAFAISTVINAYINVFIGRRLKRDTFFAFAMRSWVSTIIGQFADNFTFAVVVSKIFFGWTWVQVLSCSIVAALWEFFCEALFSPLGYRIAKNYKARAASGATA